MPDILKKILKEILVLLLIIAASFGIELLVFNYRTFVKGEKADIFYQQGGETPENLETVEEMAHGIRLVMKEPTYIKKLQLVAELPEKTQYTVYVKYENEFELEKIGRISDTYWPELGCGYTNIEKKAVVITVVFQSDIQVKINNVYLYNKILLNKYRILFLIMCFLFLYLLLFKEKAFEKRFEWIVAASCLLLGSFSVYSQGIQENGWDEQIHFKTVYQLSFLKKPVEANDTYWKMCERLTKDSYNTLEEKQLFTQYLNDKFYSNRQLIDNETNLSYNNLSYLIQAIAVWFGRKLNFSFNRIFMFGKWANLLTYVFFMFWSVRLMPKRKELVAALALVPTQIFVATTYTYDVIVHSLLVFGVVLWLKIILENETKNIYGYLIGSMLAIGIGSLSKLVYIPIILLCCFVPKEKFLKEKHYNIFKGTIVVCLILGLMAFIVPTIFLTMQNQVGVLGDPRGGDTDVVRQLQSVLAHPLEYLRILMQEMLSDFSRFFAGNAGLAFFGRMNEIAYQWVYVTVAWILGVTFVQRESDRIEIKKDYKILLSIVLFVVMCFIWTAMYLSYTPVGENVIKGVQPRYYYPLMLPLMLLCSNQVLVIKTNKVIYRKVIVAAPILLMMIGIYTKFFQL